MNAAKVGLAVQSGVSVVCATCEHYWQGRARNLPGSRCTSSTPCGSPLVGDHFHNYRGPITDFARWCFICGSEATHGVRAYGSQRMIGVCLDHAKTLHEMRPLETLTPEEQSRVGAFLLRTAAGQEAKPYQLFGYRKKTLREVIEETEAEWEAAAKARGDVDAGE